MSDYLEMVLEDERVHAEQSPAEIAELVAKRAVFAGELRRAGQLRDCGRFRPSREGKRVSRRGNEVQVESGPFAGTHTLAAYYWVDVPSLDEAVAVAERIPLLASDQVDVRPLMKGGVQPDKDHKPGKLFAFAVIGSGGTEHAWQQVMDRIDAETQNAFPAASVVGGNRLKAPSEGRRRALVDGPFLESKEVIGGVFFLRMVTIDDAVRWAADSRFVVHGVLEIRELWRS